MVDKQYIYDIEYSEYFLEHSNLEQRKQYGQFFTEVSIKNLCIDKIDEFLPKSDKYTILEPSIGSGELLISLLNYVNSRGLKYEIDCYEIDKDLYQYNKNKSYINTNIYGDDFLIQKDKKTYDIVFSNPPYVELNKYPHSDKYKNQFDDIISNRFNIYGLFISKCIQLLNMDGIGCFIIPNSLKSSPSFDKLRREIIKYCKILYIKDCGKFSIDISQNVMIFIVKKVCNVEEYNDFIIKNGDNIVFSDNKINLTYNKFMKDLDIDIVTGSFVWNQNKNILSDNKSGNDILIYNDNIQKGELKLDTSRKNKEKKNYIIKSENKKYRYIKSPCILISRCSGKNIKCCYVDKIEENLYVAENHVNVINSSNVDTLKFVYKLLTSDKLQDYIKNIQGTSSLSITQLYNLPVLI